MYSTAALLRAPSMLSVGCEERRGTLCSAYVLNGDWNMGVQPQLSQVPQVLLGTSVICHSGDKDVSPHCDSLGQRGLCWTTLRDINLPPVYVSKQGCDAQSWLVWNFLDFFNQGSYSLWFPHFFKLQICLYWPLIYCISRHAKQASLPAVFLKDPPAPLHQFPSSLPSYFLLCRLWSP